MQEAREKKNKNIKQPHPYNDYDDHHETYEYREQPPIAIPAEPYFDDCSPCATPFAPRPYVPRPCAPRPCAPRHCAPRPCIPRPVCNPRPRRVLCQPPPYYVDIPPPPPKRVRVCQDIVLC